MSLPEKSQFAGCLIGQCLGDALGFPVEGRRTDECETYVKDALDPGRPTLVACPGFLAGQYTDDSQLARELLVSCIKNHRLEPVDYARRISALFKEGRVVGPGLATMQAAERLSEGVSWEDSGARPPSAGNGSAMRAAPIGILYSDDNEKRNYASTIQGWITHQDPRCSAGAIAVAGAVALALHEDTFEPERFVLPLAEWTRPFDPLLAGALERLPAWLDLDPMVAAQEISRIGTGPELSGGWDRISPFVTTSVLWSLFAFLRSPGDYWESICTAIRAGGDVDTTAAMTGAISGAWVGLEGLPDDLARQVHDAGEWGYDDLLELADEAHQLRSAQAEAAFAG